METPKAQVYLQLTKGIARLLSLTRLYAENHPMIKSKTLEVIREIEKITAKKESLIFFVQGSLIFLNGQELEVNDTSLKRFVDDFAKLSLGSLDLEPGLTPEELDTLMILLNSTDKISGHDQVKEFLDKHNVKHIFPRFATYKLVQEDEKVVKTDKVLDLDKLPPELVKSFSSDLRNNVIKDKDLVHNAPFLSSVLSDLADTTNTHEELLRIIWVIGEYLIDEISTAKEEEVNRKVLEQLKTHLVSHWEKKPEKREWKAKTEDSFTKVVAAMQLKGLIVLYKKHKKEVENVAHKIKTLLDDIPPESKLYQKTKEELKQIGIPGLDNQMFA